MAAGVTSSVSGSTTTYVITDQGGNTLTITAPAAGSTGLTFVSSGGLLVDGQAELSRLILMLQTNLRPQFLSNTVDSPYS